MLAIYVSSEIHMQHKCYYFGSYSKCIAVHLNLQHVNHIVHIKIPDCVTLTRKCSPYKDTVLIPFLVTMIMYV